MTEVVHYLSCGVTPCMMPTPAASWPDHHKWASEWDDVTCVACLRGRAWADQNVTTFIKASDDSAIKCLHCLRVSHNPQDAHNGYCGHCHVYHEDIWPPARRWWIENPEPKRRTDET